MINKNFNKIISDRITSLRENNGLNIEQLAYRSGISKGGLSEIERGLKEPRSYTIIRICAGLGISISDFYDFEEIKNFQNSL